MLDGTSHPVPSPIAQRLRHLRRRMTCWVFVDGLSRVLLCLVAFVALDLLLDWTFQMDRAQRGVMLALAIAGTLVIAYRRLCRPLLVRPTDDALVLEVEDQHPELRESLISAVQFARQPENTAGVSPAMVRATVDLGARAAEQVEFSSVLHQRRFLANAALLAAGVLLLGGTAVAGLASDTVAIWFNRNVLLGEREWPQDVHFQIAGAVDDVLTVPRGEDWPLEAIVTEDSRRLPDEAWLEIRGRRQRQRMESADGGRTFKANLANVSEPFAIRVVEARAASPWIRVQLVDRPAVTSLELTVSPPAYTGSAPEALPPGGGPYKALQGSALAIRGEANKPLSVATLTLGQMRHNMQISAGHRIALDLSADHVKDGDYAIDLLDTEQLWMPGHEGPQPLASREPATFRLRLAPDREPQVQARLKGIGTLVTQRAYIPIECRITDDFAVADLRLQHRWRGETDEADTTGTQSLKALADLPAPMASFEHMFDLEPLKLPTGLSLSFVVEADDNNTVSGPGTGRSTVFLVRVVTEAEFRAALLAREREQRAEFEKRIKLQDELLTDCRALLAAVRGAADLDAQRRDELAKLQKRQKTVGDDLSRIARRFEDIVVEVRQNRIEEDDGPVQTRLSEQIITPLWSVATDGVSAVVQALERARLRASASVERDASLSQAAAAQQRVLDQLREILASMEQAEGFQEAVNALLEVQKAQQDVLQRTDKEKQEAIRRLLEGAGSKPAGNTRND